MNRYTIARAMSISALLALISGIPAQGQTAPAQEKESTTPSSSLGAIFPQKELKVGDKCRPEQRFYLRQRISGQSILFCDLDIGAGASFSYARNSVTSTTDLTARAGVGMRLGRILSFGNQTKAGFIGYAEIDSQNNSAGSDESQLRFGIEGNFLTDFDGASPKASGTFIYSVGVYYLTDADFEASGYGIKASAYPEIPGLRINFKKPRQNFHWELLTSLDVLKLNEAGSTGLAPDTDYAWATISLKGIYKAKPKIFPNGIEASFGGVYTKDTVSGDELHQLSAGAKIFLDKDERVALSLEHSRGETISNPTYSKTTTLNLEFKF